LNSHLTGLRLAISAGPVNGMSMRLAKYQTFPGT
jgi:hypothetical protein